MRRIGLALIAVVFPLMAYANDFIQIRKVDGRPLFYSQHTGYFWSLGMNTFMDTWDNFPLKKVINETTRHGIYDEQLKLLEDLSYNTISGWSDLDYLKDRMPFAVVLLDDTTDVPTAGPLLNFNGKKPEAPEVKIFPIGDPYDPTYKSALDSYIKKVVTPYKDSPMLLCYWAGGEMGLGDTDGIDFSDFVFSTGVQRKLTQWLTKKYDDIGKLNKLWKTSHSNFIAAAKSELGDPKAPDQHRVDLQDFASLMLRDWTHLVVQTIHKYDKNHLISSPKIDLWDYPYLERPVSLKHFESFKEFDFISVDWYTKRLQYPRDGMKQLNQLSDSLGLPVLVAEFGTRVKIVNGTNKPGAGKFVANQKERGERYNTQVLDLFSNPRIIGAHWFKWQDHAGKDQMNKGIIYVQDEKIVPYIELTDAMKKTNLEITSRVKKLSSTNF
jgi:hypothetical protein